MTDEREQGRKDCNVDLCTGLSVETPVALRAREIYALTLDLSNEGSRIIVRIRPSGEVEFQGSLSEAAHAFYLAVGEAVAAAQSRELLQLREEHDALKGRHVFAMAEAHRANECLKNGLTFDRLHSEGRVAIAILNGIAKE